MIAVTETAKDISTPHNAFIETGTDMNSKNVVTSADKPIARRFSFLRVRRISNINARKGAKMKIAPILCIKFITLFQPPSINDRMSAKLAMYMATA